MKKTGWSSLLAATFTVAMTLTACGENSQPSENPMQTEPIAGLEIQTPAPQEFDPTVLDGEWTMDFYAEDGACLFSYEVNLDSEGSLADVQLLTGDALRFNYIPETDQISLNVTFDDGEEITCKGAYEVQNDHIALHMQTYRNSREVGFEEDPKIFWNSYKRHGSDTLVYIQSATPFAEGAAWITIGEWKYNGIPVSKQTMLIDRKGQVLFAAPQEVQSSSVNLLGIRDPLTTQFAKGVSFLDLGSDQMLINPAGEVIWSVSENGWAEAERIFGAGAVENISMRTDISDFTGYSVVEMEVNTFEITEDMCGILNPDGTWLMEPGKHEEGVLSIELKDHSAYAELAFKDREKISTYYYGAIRLETGEQCSLYAGGHDPKQYYPNLFDGSDGSNLHIGSLEPVRWQAERDRSLQNGLLYLDDRQAFVDTAGNVVIDLSEYTFLTDFNRHFTPEFRNGYSFLAIENPSGEPYFTVINTAGEQLFPPVKYSEEGRGEVSEDIVLILNTPFSYDLQGNQLPVHEGIFRSSFSDGLQLVQIHNEINHVAYYYQDKDGTNPFPQ